MVSLGTVLVLEQAAGRGVTARGPCEPGGVRGGGGGAGRAHRCGARLLSATTDSRVRRACLEMWFTSYIYIYEYNVILYRIFTLIIHTVIYNI